MAQLPHPHVVRDGSFVDIPPNVVPNYIDPESNGDYYTVAGGLTLAVAGITVVLRLYTVISGQGIRRLSAQDYLLVLALLFAIARYVLYTMDIQYYGVSLHIWDVQLPFDDNLWGIGNTMYPAGMMCAKLSILLLYLDVFGKVHTKFRWCTYALIGFDMSYLFAYLLVTIFWCDPIIVTWRLSAANGRPYHCVEGYIVDLVIGGLNLFTDLAILILPMPIVLRLQMTPWRKLGVIGVFAIGLVAVVIVIIREVVIQQKLNNEDADQTWAVVYEATWVSVELHIAIICGAVMVLPQLLRQISHTRIGRRLRNFITPTRPSNKASDKHTIGSSPIGGPSMKGYRRTDSIDAIELRSPTEESWK